VLLVAALAAATVAAAVERKRDDEDGAEQVATVSGTLARDGDELTLAGKELGVGPRWWRETAKVADYDGDGTVETVAVELAGLAGKHVTVVAEVEGDELSVRTIGGKALRAAGRPPWAGGPKGDAKCKAKAAKLAAKQKAKAAGKGHGPPAWAKAHGRKGC
jgi:hypothetical protein